LLACLLACLLTDYRKSKHPCQPLFLNLFHYTNSLSESQEIPSTLNFVFFSEAVIIGEDYADFILSEYKSGSADGFIILI